MDKNPMLRVREMLYERLSHFDFTPAEQNLDDKSLYQLVSLLYLLVGGRNYLGCFTTTVRSLDEIFGDQIYARPEKPENLVNDMEPKFKEVVH